MLILYLCLYRVFMTCKFSYLSLWQTHKKAKKQKARSFTSKIQYVLKPKLLQLLMIGLDGGVM